MINTAMLSCYLIYSEWIISWCIP